MNLSVLSTECIGPSSRNGRGSQDDKAWEVAVLAIPFRDSFHSYLLDSPFLRFNSYV
jgi:hypothetical protein